MKTMNTVRILGTLFLGVLLGLMSLQVAVAVPTGPSSITPLSSSRFPVTSASNFSAIAGNVTELNFDGSSTTSTWQGYFGNISGSILLGDANNHTLYNWSSASPSGEIYATRSATAPIWSAIRCADQAEVDAEDLALGVNSTVDQDAVNRTFTDATVFDPFYVGDVSITDQPDCRATYLNDETGSPSSDFQEVLLHDGATLVYAALISQDSTGFDNGAHDFEMLVGEDGHNGDIDPTTYYFYVELG